ncbi:hypothetical protein JTB14_000540 [Gonioctena quinquepunctata]|nr:hypothetical protein JTB14_000540 [Gonioctena quinquepunctata]
MVFKLLYCTFGKVKIPQRYMLIFMLQLALINAYHLRVVLNIAITEIIQPLNYTKNFYACPEYNYTAVDTEEGKFNWPIWMETGILYAFYIGYIFSQVPGAWLADKFGAKHVMGICMLSSTIINLFYPLAIQKGGYYGAIVLRIFLGVAQGPMLPIISTFIQCWVPPNERAVLGGIAFGGSNMGAVTGNLFTGLIIKNTGSWAMSFYVWGVFALIWYIFYMLMVFSKPSTHPFISEEERNFLESAIERGDSFEVPWLKICRSLPVWALLVGQYAHNYIFFTILTDLPKYFKDILNMDVDKNAASTALPFLALWISNIIFSIISSFLTNRNILSIILARRLWTSVSLILPSCLLVLAVYVGCNRVVAIALVTLAFFLVGPFFAGAKININDLTIHYAGTISAMVNGITATSGILAPFIVGILTRQKTLEEWYIVFLIMLIISMLFSLIYCLIAKVDRQHWDFPKNTQQTNEI